MGKYVTIGFSLALVGIIGVPRAYAGCGCDKPPPPPAQIRPNVAYPGAPITFFSPALAVGQQYTVTFSNGITGVSAAVPGQAVLRRDLADGTYKTELVVPLPPVPIGPTTAVVTTTDPTPTDIVFIADSDFTVAPLPLVVPAQIGSFNTEVYQAAVGRDGTVYVALDLSSAALPLVVEAQALGYPLRFGAENVVFKNIQGFLMQLLVQGGGTPIPGMWVIPSAPLDASTKSDTLHYSRHEFETYFVQHQERQPHALDATDPNWHLDGTRHIDHNHLILAIIGQVGGVTPAAGVTPPFTLAMRTYSLFSRGLVGVNSVTVSAQASTDGYTPPNPSTNATGDVFSNGLVAVSGMGTVNGSAIAGAFSVSALGTITGTQTLLTVPRTFMQVSLPTGLTDLGMIWLGTATQTLNGPGSFLASQLYIGSGGKLIVNNTAGPVTLYVTGGVTVNGKVQVVDPNPEKFAIYVAGLGPVSLSNLSAYYGVVYAPTSPLSISGMGNFSGSFVANTVKLSGQARVHYDQALRGE